MSKLTFDQLQEEQAAWARKNFGDGPEKWRGAFMGVVEEVGELSHALLKQEQGIRGSSAKHEEAAKDAVGDVIIYLADLCTRRGWSLGSIMEQTWGEVSKRDWSKNKETGKAA